MAISDNAKADQTGPTNRPSTLPHYRPGQPYFYPAFKIDKLKKEELVPGAKPPARLITLLPPFMREPAEDLTYSLLTNTFASLKETFVKTSLSTAEMPSFGLTTSMTL